MGRILKKPEEKKDDGPATDSYGREIIKVEKKDEVKQAKMI